MEKRVWPMPFSNRIRATPRAGGRNPCSARAGTGVRQNSSPHTTISMTSQSRNWNVGMGNQLQRSRRIVTVGLYTERKPVEASSTMCSANATHRANHAPPKPDAESEEGGRRMGITPWILNHLSANGNRNPPFELHELPHRLPEPGERADSLISASTFPSQPRKNSIHKPHLSIQPHSC